MNVKESTNEKVMELLPGLQNIRQKTLPQMYFEACSIFRGTFDRVNPLFSHPEDAVMILWARRIWQDILYVHVTVVSTLQGISCSYLEYDCLFNRDNRSNKKKSGESTSDRWTDSTTCTC